MGWADPRFLTFNQAKEAGGTVRKGEHGTSVICVGAAKDKQLETREEGDEPARGSFLKSCSTSPSAKVCRRASPARSSGAKSTGTNATS